MARTATERRIIQKRSAAKSGAVLVPILEELLEDQCEPEDEEDFGFMDMLMRVRATPREKGIFSPSMLGSCIRQAYFAKRGTEKHLARNPQTNGYFLTGNFTHFKWQFAMFKAHRKGLLKLLTVKSEVGMPDGAGERPAVEVRVIDGDWGGTIDVIPVIDNVPYIVDFKGVNLIDFQRTVKKGAKHEYRKQLVGYGKIANKVLGLGIEECLLISEAKPGPINGGSPLALHETRVPMAEFDGEVNRRLRTLRWFDSHDETPPPSCVSTMHMQFQECPFARFCRDEVKAVQTERERRARKQSRDWTPARPQR